MTRSLTFLYNYESLVPGFRNPWFVTRDYFFLQFPSLVSRHPSLSFTLTTVILYSIFTAWNRSATSKSSRFIPLLSSSAIPNGRDTPLSLLAFTSSVSALAVSDEGNQWALYRDSPCRKSSAGFPMQSCPGLPANCTIRLWHRSKNGWLNYSPVIEQPSYSSSYIDLTGNPPPVGTGTKRALQAGKRTGIDLGTPAFSGLAINKLVSKTAADQAIFSNEKLIIVPEGEEVRFRRLILIDILPDIQQDMLIRLRDLNLLIVGDVQRVDVSYLKQNLPDFWVSRFTNTPAELMTGWSRQISDLTALTEKIVFQGPTNDGELVRGYLFNGLHRLCQTLRSRNLWLGKFQISLQFADHQTDYRQLNFPGGIHAERLVYETGRLLAGMLIRRVQVGLMVITADRLFRTVEQLLLWDTNEETREDKIFKAIDRLELKYGHQWWNLRAWRDTNALTTKSTKYTKEK